MKSAATDAASGSPATSRLTASACREPTALAPRRRRHVADTGSVDGVQNPLRRDMQAAVALAERQTALFNNELFQRNPL